jgi:hypothetical protein
MSHPAFLKACGLLPDVTLKQLRDASISPKQAQAVADQVCLHPDYPDRELAETEPAAIALAFTGIYDPATCHAIHGMHKRYLEATGSGSWPPGKTCHSALYPHPNYHAATVFIDFDAFIKNNTINREVTDSEWQRTIVDAKVWPTLANPVASVAECKQTFRYGGERVSAHDRPQWRERSGKKLGDVFTMFDMSTWLVLEGARRTGCLYLEVFTGSDGAHQVHENMIPIPGSTSGFAYFNNGTCGDHVTSNIDSGLTYSLGSLTSLRQHEFGHTKNLPHEFNEPQSRHRSVMSYAFISEPYQGYREEGSPYQYTRDHSWDRLIRFFGGEAALPVSPVSPPPPPPGSNPETLPGLFRALPWSGGIEVVGGMKLPDGFTIKGDAEYIMYPASGGYVLRLKPPT